MEDLIFNEEDRLQLQTLGILEEEALAQIRTHQKSSFFITLERSCSMGDGIQKIPPEVVEIYLQAHSSAAQEGRFLKFVPASGAASRMFKIPFQFLTQNYAYQEDDWCESGTPDVALKKDFEYCMEEIQKIAFYPELQKVMEESGQDLSDLLKIGQYQTVLEYLLTPKGLNYGALPKGLMKFHRYPSGSRTALEEHLMEGVNYVHDREGICRFHVTTSPEHQKAFKDFFAAVRPGYEKTGHFRLDVEFSIQSHSTDTLAVEGDNRPFRDKQGRLVFRAGGHGALLQNLNQIQGDLIYIKNIDNVVRDPFKDSTILWKKILGGFLVILQRKIHKYVKIITGGDPDRGFLREVMQFIHNNLHIPEPSDFKEWNLDLQKEFLKRKLIRPLRVCGMVRNVGDPGGGPFWVRNKDRELSLQIVEQAQVHMANEDQQAIWKASTYFNPVDLVCAVRDFKGRPFNLMEFIDPEAVFITQKSKEGKELKALELPGLWNGSMSHWLTVFVEVPNSTYNPVKKVTDLLRPEHQPS